MTSRSASRAILPALEPKATPIPINNSPASRGLVNVGSPSGSTRYRTYPSATAPPVAAAE